MTTFDMDRAIANAGVEARNRTTLAAIGAYRTELGMDGGDILLALAQDLKTWDPFNIFCRLWGNCMKWMTEWGGAVASVVSIFLLIELLARLGASFIAVINRLSKTWWGKGILAAAGAAAVGAGAAIFFDEDEKKEQEEMSPEEKAAMSEAVRGVFYDFLPGPVRAMLVPFIGLVANQVSGAVESGATGKVANKVQKAVASLPNVASGAVAAVAPVLSAQNSFMSALGSGAVDLAGKGIGWLVEQAFSKDADELTDAEWDSLGVEVGTTGAALKQAYTDSER